MNIATAHISGTNLDLLVDSLEKSITRPYTFSSGSLRVIAFGMPPASLFGVITAIVMDFGISGECEVKIYSGGSGRSTEWGLDCRDELSSIGLVLEVMKNASMAYGWQYSEQRRVMEYPFDTEAS